MKKQLTRAALAIAVLAGTVGYAAAQDDRYYDRDDNRYYDRGDGRYDRDDSYRYYDHDGRYYDRYDGYRRGIHVARETGFHDGADMAREDTWRGKRFNPKPRGRYDDKDHGYRHEFGSKHEYRERYAEAYRAGYGQAFRGRGDYDRGWGR